MEYINNVITRYQQCIGKYDKQIWEQAIERKPQSAPRKMAKVNPDLIDVDLFRTSPFSKSKPQQSWLTACRKAFPRVIFFPFYCRWWLRTTSRAIFSVLLFLYLLQFFILVLSYIHNGYSFLSESMSVAHVLSPCLMLFLLAVIHIQVVSTYESSSQYSRFKSFATATATGSAAATDPKQFHRQKATSQVCRSKSGKSRKKCSKKVEVNGTVDAESTGSLDTGIDLDVQQNSSSKHGSSAVTRGRGNTEETHGHRSIPEHQTSEDCVGSEAEGGEVVDLDLQVIDRSDSTRDWVCRHSTSHLSDVLNDNVALLKSADKLIETLGDREEVRNNKPSITFNKSQYNVCNCSSLRNRSRGELLLDDIEPLVGPNMSTRARKRSLSVKGLGATGPQSSADFVTYGITSRSARVSSSTDLYDRNKLENQSELNLTDSAAAPPENDSSDCLVVRACEKSSAVCDHYCCMRDICQHSARSLSAGFIESDDDSDCLEQKNSRCSIIGGKPKYSSKSAKVKVSFDSISIANSNSSLSNTCDSSLHSSDGEDACRNEVQRNQNAPRGLYKPASIVGSPARNIAASPMRNIAGSPARKISASPMRKIAGSPVKKIAASPVRKIVNNHVKRVMSEQRQKRSYTSKHVTTQRFHEGQSQRFHETQSLTDRLDCPSSEVDGALGYTESSSNEQQKDELREGSREVRNRRKDALETWCKDQEDAGNTEDVSSASDGTSVTCSSSELSARDVCDEEDEMNVNTSHGIQHASSILNSLASTNDRVSCMIWEADGIHKVNLSVLDIGFTIIRKVDLLPESCHYLLVGMLFSVLAMLTPIAYRIYHGRQDITVPLSYRNLTNLYTAAQIAMGDSWCESAIVMSGLVQRFFLSLIFFFLLSVAERTFKQRLLYAKNFCYLTSSRRAKKYDLPHFRLNKVRNIKTWLSLRSFLKKRGPQRSVECIVSAAFLITVIILSIVCLEMLQDYDSFLDYLGNWELAIWCMFLGIYLLRFMTLGTKINQKYRNFSLLITEQMNLYLHMEQKPHKKDELMVANSVLRLAEELLKELESPFKISGLSANPLLYNITKVIVLSAFSAVLTDVLGFKLKLYKIKLKS